MSINADDQSFGNGVIFQSRDCAGFFRRFFQLVIDAISMFALVVMLIMPLGMDPADSGLLWVTVHAVYLLGLKLIGVRSVGYWLTGCKVVDLRGKRPAFWRLALREGFAYTSFVLFLFDLAWCGMNSDRRSLRDCIFGTMVVRCNAQPCSQGTIHLQWLYFANMHTFAYPVVSRPVRVMERSPS